MSYTLPSDTHSTGDAGHTTDHNNLADVLTGMGGTYSVLNTAWSGGADPQGVADSTAAINNALSSAPAGTIVTGPPGTYKTTAPLVVPNFVGLHLGAPRAMGIPIGNYGIGGLAVHGAVIKPAATFSGAAVIDMLGSASQGGGQNLRNITIDGTTLPAGSVHGIRGHGGVAGVTIRDCLVYGVTGNGLHADSDGTSQPDFWHVAACKFSGCGGDGAHITGLADSWFTDCEATGNTGDGWDITTGNNARYANCKGEGNGGYGWNLQAASGYSGYAAFPGCTSGSNTTAGFSVSGTGTGIYNLDSTHAQDTTPYTFSGSNTVLPSTTSAGLTAVPPVLRAPAGGTAETFPRAHAVTVSSALTSGTLYVASVAMNAGTQVSNISFFVNSTAKTGGTHGWYVLCDKNMKVLGVTADKTDAATTWGTINAEAKIAVVTPFVIPASDVYYLGVMVATSAGTQPTFTVGTAVASGIAGPAPVLCGTSSTGQTTPPSVGAALTAPTGLGTVNFYAYTS